MKKWSIIIGFCILLTAAGCSKDMANRDVYEESGDTINVNNKREELYNEGGGQGVRKVSDNYGFVRHQKALSRTIGEAPNTIRQLTVNK